jgi:hypothetical protein
MAIPKSDMIISEINNGHLYDISPMLGQSQSLLKVIKTLDDEPNCITLLIPVMS